MLPMPISPTPTASMPSSLAMWARSRPTDRARRASCSVMAGSAAMSPVEKRTFRSSTWGQDTGTQMPTSTTWTWSPKYAARADMPVLCRVMFTACCTVTDWGAQDTPSATTPLSAASTVTRHRSIRGRGVLRMPASRMDMSSRAPRLPGGLASSACRRRAASMASRSAGRMDSIYAVNSCLVMCSLRIRAAAASRETGRSPDFPM